MASWGSGFLSVQGHCSMLIGLHLTKGKPCSIISDTMAPLLLTSVASLTDPIMLQRCNQGTNVLTVEVSNSRREGTWLFETYCYDSGVTHSDLYSTLLQFFAQPGLKWPKWEACIEVSSMINRNILLWFRSHSHLDFSPLPFFTQPALKGPKWIASRVLG